MASDNKGDNEQPKNKGGRPEGTVELPYMQENEEWAYKFALLGLKDERIADQFEVSIGTFEQWKRDHPELREALKNGRERADTNVTKSLYESARGYTLEAEKVFMHQGKIIKTTVKEYYAPNPTSAIFWLKNRQKEQWRDKQEVELSGKLAPIEISITLPKDED